METPLAHVFHAPATLHMLEDELYPFMVTDSCEHELILSEFPVSVTDLDFAEALRTPPSATVHSSSHLLLEPLENQMMHQPLNLPMSPSPFPDLARAQPTSVCVSPRKTSCLDSRQCSTPFVPSALRATRFDLLTHSPPSSVSCLDKSKSDCEKILKAPVKSLTEDEKKLRRRAQVAKSARKHRNRQKEELAKLREQVQMLQAQMATMTPCQESRCGTRIKREPNVILQHRKRKKGDDEDKKRVLTNPTAGLVEMPPQKPHIRHWYHRLPANMLKRTTILTRIADERMAMGEQIIRPEFGPKTSFPLTDMKLTSNGPALEIKQARGRLVSNFSHHEVGEACWNSFANFVLDVPERFRRHVKCERLMEVDSNTRYGRTRVPLLRDQKGRIIFFHSYFVVRRQVRDDYVMITWETIFEDDLYPPLADENPETTLRNDEVGCMIIESEITPDQGVRTIYRSITHSTPPVGGLPLPRGKVIEAFMTVCCRNADTIENSAWNLLMKTHPERLPKTA